MKIILNCNIGCGIINKKYIPERKVCLNKVKRKNEIAFINVILCMMVIFIHTASELITKQEIGSAGYIAAFIPWRISSFAVHGFIFLSGLKLNLKNEIKYVSFYLKRVTTVIIPYIIWVAAYYIYFCVNHYFEFDISELGGYIIRGDLSAHFYFVIVIVQFYLLFPLWRKLFKTLPPSAVLPVAAMITIASQMYITDAVSKYIGIQLPDFTDKVFTSYLFDWAVGCYCGLYYDKFISGLKSHRKAVYISAAILTLLDLTIFYESEKTGQLMPWLAYVHMLFSVSATIALYDAALHLAKKQDIIITLIDRGSYYIYLSHSLVITYLINCMNTVQPVDSLFRRFLIVAAGAYLMPIVVCSLYANIKSFIKTSLSSRRIERTGD